MYYIQNMHSLRGLSRNGVGTTSIRSVEASTNEHPGRLFSRSTSSARLFLLRTFVRFGGGNRRPNRGGRMEDDLWWILRRQTWRYWKSEEDDDIYVTRLPVGFFLDRVADGARGSIPFGKLVLGTILHFIFIINAVERRREKKNWKKKQRGEKEKEKERERKGKKSSGGVFARTGIWPCCVAAPPRESPEFLFTAVSAPWR